MRLRKNHPIDIKNEYPCPCRRQGKLCNIILTEAMGCQLCQTIFVLSPSGESIEQLNAHYPYKKAWAWTGRRWINTDKSWQNNYLILVSLCFVFSILIAIPVLIGLKGGINIISAIMVGLILILLSTFLWCVYRR